MEKLSSSTFMGTESHMNKSEFVVLDVLWLCSEEKRIWKQMAVSGMKTIRDAPKSYLDWNDHILKCLGEQMESKDIKIHTKTKSSHHYRATHLFVCLF